MRAREVNMADKPNRFLISRILALNGENAPVPVSHLYMGTKEHQSNTLPCIAKCVIKLIAVHFYKTNCVKYVAHLVHIHLFTSIQQEASG